MHSAHDFRSVKAKIRVLCKQRRTRLEEFMKTFDIHHVKKIKVDQFKRALDVSGLQLTAEEMGVIIAKYRLQHEPGFVDYQRFCNLIDKAFTVKGLEARPGLRTSIHHDLPVQKKFALVSLTGSEQQSLHKAMNKLAVAVRNKGIVLKDVFHDFDRSNAGKVTRTQFIRDLLDIVVLSSEEVDAIVKAYGNELDVNYRLLHNDLSPQSASTPNGPLSPEWPRRRTAPSPTRGESQQHLVEELESSLAELTSRDRIRTKNFFTDFDPLRTGKCTEAQFKRCVKLCFSMVSESDLELLVMKYVLDNSGEPTTVRKVDYVRFCDSIEGKIVLDNNNDDVLAAITAQTMSSSGQLNKCSRDARGNLSDSEFALFQSTMLRLSAYCAQRRLLFKPTFQDFDKGRREHITVEQFFRVMTMLKLTLESENERKVLLKRYASAHGDRFVNYVTFCHDIEHWEENNNRPTSSGGRSTKVASEILSPSRVHADSFEASSGTSQTRSVRMIMKYIKQTAKRDRVRLEEYYRDFDKLRHGKVTYAQFASGLDAGGMLLNKDEVQLLADEYALDGNVDSAGNRWVAWKRFVDDVESVFTIKGLERTPNRDLGDLQTKGEQFGGIKKEKELTLEEEHIVTDAVVAMRKAMDRQRMEIKAAFEDFDRSKQGFISATKFDRVLSMFHLLPESAVARLIVIKFREQTTAGTSATLSSICDVNYRAFLQSLEVVGHTLASGENPEKLILPSSVAYRQGVYGSGKELLDAMQRQQRREDIQQAEISLVLSELRRQINTKRIRMKEFVVEGDKLRSGEITVAKFHTALNRSGCLLDAADVETVTHHFRSPKNLDKVDWRAFLDALDANHPELLDPVDGGKEDEPFDSKVTGILTKLRSEVNNRRLHMKPYFQDYDHNSVCRVTKFQFAAVLDMMKVNLKAFEVEALQHAFAVREGARKVTNDVNYVDFIRAVDSDYS